MATNHRGPLDLSGPNPTLDRSRLRAWPLLKGRIVRQNGPRFGGTILRQASGYGRTGHAQDAGDVPDGPPVAFELESPFTGCLVNTTRTTPRATLGFNAIPCSTNPVVDRRSFKTCGKPERKDEHLRGHVVLVRRDLQVIAHGNQRHTSLAQLLDNQEGVGHTRAHESIEFEDINGRVQIQYFFTNISARQSPARRDQCVGVRIGRHVPATA